MAKSAPYVSESCAGIIKGLKSLASRNSLWSVFEDWLKVCAISISNAVDWNHREEREKQYLETINKYTSDEQKILIETFTELVIALEREHTKSGPFDLLGKVFHSLELHNKYHGQFFTPFHLCEFMGQVALGDGGEAGNNVRDSLSQKGYVSVCEPCVGSGGMVLGFAKAMYKEKLNYCEQMVAYCCDIDIKCVYMAYLQLSLYGIPAVIIHGNSLTLEEWSHWYTPTYMINAWPLREKIGNLMQTIHTAAKEKAEQSAPEQIKKEVKPSELDLIIKKNGQLSLF